MKQINKNTILRQGSNEFKGVEVGELIFWICESSKIKENTNTFEKGVNGDWYYNSIYKAIGNIGDITNYDFKIIAQTTNKLDGIPVINLDSCVEILAEKYAKDWVVNFKKQIENFNLLNIREEMLASGFINGYKSNPNTYTEKDIEKAFECGRNYQLTGEGSLKETKNYISSIEVIEVDSKFNILNIE